MTTCEIASRGAYDASASAVLCASKNGDGVTLRGNLLRTIPAGPDLESPSPNLRPADRCSVSSRAQYSCHVTILLQAAKTRGKWDKGHDLSSMPHRAAGVVGGCTEPLAELSTEDFVIDPTAKAAAFAKQRRQRQDRLLLPAASSQQHDGI